jgi:hypothetical protein
VRLNAHIVCNAIVVLLGALYTDSATGTPPSPIAVAGLTLVAFNSLVIGVIIFQYLS